MTFTFPMLQPASYVSSTWTSSCGIGLVDGSLPIVQAWDDDDDLDDEVVDPVDEDADVDGATIAPLIEEEEDPFQGFEENDFDDDFDDDFEEELEDDYEIEPDDSEMFPAGNGEDLDDDIDILE